MAVLLRPPQMTRAPWLVIPAALLLVAVLLGPTPATANRPAAPPPVVRGTVLTAGEQPLARATVSLRAPLSAAERARAIADGRSLEAAVSTQTGADGRYQLDAPAYGLWRLEIRAAAHAAREVELYPLLHDRELLPVALAPARVVSLRVVDESGQAIAGARVDALTQDGPLRIGGPARVQAARERARSLVSTAETSDEGIADVLLPTDRLFRVHVQADGYVPQTRADLDTSSNDAKIELRLESGAPRWVCVRSPTDQPAGGAVISVSPLAATFADARGCATLRLPDGAQLVAHLDDGSRADQLVTADEVQVELTPRAAITLRARPPYAARGVVLRRPASPLSEGREGAATSSRLHANPESTAAQSTSVEPVPQPAATIWSDAGTVVGSNAAGEFELALHPPLRPGALTYLLAAARGGRTKTVDLDLAAAGGAFDRGLLPPIVLEPTTTLRGTVQTPDFEPIANATVWLRENKQTAPQLAGTGTGPIRTARTDAAGRFVIKGVSTTAHFELVGEAPGFAEGSVAVSARGTLDPLDQRPLLRLEPSLSAWGRILDVSERPVAGAQVALRPALADTSEVEELVKRALDAAAHTTKSNAEGKFTFAQLSPGRFDIAVSAEGYATAVVPGVEVARTSSSGAFEIGEVTLSPSVSLEGLVVDEDGAPLSGIEIRMHEDGDEMPLRASSQANLPTAITSENGSFHLHGLAADAKLKLSLRGAGFAPLARTQVSATHDEPLRLVMTRAARLVVHTVDAQDQPVASRVVLTLLQGERKLHALEQNEDSRGGSTPPSDGTFEFTDLAPGVWSVIAVADGFVRRDQDGVALTAEHRSHELTLQLQHGATLRGVVTDFEAKPLAGARVSVVPKTRSTSGLWTTRTRNLATQTDNAGNYQLTSLPTGPLTLEVHHEEVPPLLTAVEIEAGENHLDVQLEPAKEITGRVIDSSGAPLGGADVAAHRAGDISSLVFDMLSGELPHETQSLPDGSFRITGLGNGRYHLSTDHDDFAAASVALPLDLKGVSISGVELVLERGSTLSGRVHGLDFDQLADVRVSMVCPGASAGRFGTAVDHEGRYRLEHLGPCGWLVRASLDTHASTSLVRTLSIEPGASGREFTLDLDFKGGISLSGVVMRDGRPVQGYHVAAASPQTFLGANTVTEADGRFSFAGLDGGLYDLTTSNLRDIAQVREIDLRSDLELIIDLDANTIIGSVVDERTGEPVVGAELYVAAARHNRSVTVGLDTTHWSGADGSFYISGVWPGRYRLTASAGGFATGHRDVTIRANEPLIVDIALEPQQGASVRLRRSDGAIVRRADVVVLDAAGLPLFMRRLEAFDDGRVELPDVPTGSWTVLASASGTATGRALLNVPGEAPTLLLPPASMVRVRVGDGVQETSATSVQLLTPSGEPYREIRMFTLRNEYPLIDGRATLSPVPPGSWVLQVRATGGAIVATRSFEAHAEAVVEVEVEINGAFE